MKNIDDLNNKINNLKDAATKYYGYPEGEFQDMPFYEPDTEELSEKAEKLRKKTLKGVYLFTGVFLLFLIIGIISGASFKGILIMSVLTAIMIVVCICMTRKKAEIAIGTAVFKYDEGNVGTKQKRYYVSIIVEGVIYTRLPIRRNDYDKVEEGTQILIEKVSGWASVL